MEAMEEMNEVDEREIQLYEGINDMTRPGGSWSWAPEDDDDDDDDAAHSPHYPTMSALINCCLSLTSGRLPTASGSGC